MEIQLLAVIVSQDERGGGYAANLLARKGDIIQKNIHLFGRYKQTCHTWGTMESLILALSQLQKEGQKVTILNNPYCSVGSFSFWRLLEEMPATKSQASLKNKLKALNIELSNRQINMQNRDEKNLYQAAHRLADKCSRLSQLYDSHFICLKCLLDYNPDEARMWGWQCAECREQALAEI